MIRGQFLLISHGLESVFWVMCLGVEIYVAYSTLREAGRGDMRHGDKASCERRKRLRIHFA